MSSVATFGVDDAATHAVMLLDRLRIEAFARAIAATVREGDVVADVGAGTGVLAALAARAGARRVFAIERGPAAQVARRVIDDNGLGDVVEIVRADAREVRLPEAPTVLISETLGCFGVDEGVLALLALVARQAAPGVRVIPARVEPMVAAIEDAALASELASLGELPGAGGLSLAGLRGPLAHRPLPCRLRAGDVASEAGSCGVFRPGHDALPRAIGATVVATRAARVNAIGGWFRAELSDGVAIDTGPLAAVTHWSHVMLPIDPPIACEAGASIAIEVRPRVLGDRAMWAWRARSGGEERAGDAMRGLLGDAREVAAQIAGRSSEGGAGGDEAMRARLEAFRAALRGEGSVDAATLAARLRAAMPERYADEADAEQAIWPLLSAARGG